MAIVDYTHKKDLAYQKLTSRDDISKQNRKHLNEFLDQYVVSDARLGLFYKHIGFLLAGTADIKKDMADRNKINALFKHFREELSPGYYTTIVNVSLRFVRWLNDGERPKGFKDIKNLSKKTQMRNLEARDMLSIEDAKEMMKQSNSLQIKAAIMTQLDGGFRPSEFIDLNFGDIVKDGRFMWAQVRKGKTGKREVPLSRCVPYLNRWLDSHPTKKKNDPLWITEFNFKSRRNPKGFVRYDYFALSKRIKELGEKAEIKKPLDFYSIRHSAVTLDKKDGLPAELNCEKFGHSMEYYLNTYGRLSDEDKRNRHKEARGEKTHKKQESPKEIACDICGTVNEPDKEMCEKCGSPLTLKKAMRLKSSQDSEIDQLKAEVQNIKKDISAQIIELLKENPDTLREALKIKQ